MMDTPTDEEFIYFKCADKNIVCLTSQENILMKSYFITVRVSGTDIRRINIAHIRYYSPGGNTYTTIKFSDNDWLTVEGSPSDLDAKIIEAQKGAN